MSKTVNVKGKEWSKQDIIDLLSRNDKAVQKALLLIYNNQTDAEKDSFSTVAENGIGFTGADAFILTSFAQQLQDKKWLSPKQMDITRKKIKKYSGQILRYMEAQNV